MTKLTVPKDKACINTYQRQHNLFNLKARGIEWTRFTSGHKNIEIDSFFFFYAR
jgi:hypothetical protein